MTTKRLAVIGRWYRAMPRRWVLGSAKPGLPGFKCRLHYLLYHRGQVTSLLHALVPLFNQ